MIVDTLIEAIDAAKNPTALGLDTRWEYLPESFRAQFDGTTPQGAAEAILAYNTQLVAALRDIIPCVKVQVAYYEMLGLAGMQAFRDTCQMAKAAGMVVISDVKRNDIGATSEAYAMAHLGRTPLDGTEFSGFPTDFATVNPYLGSDGIIPFMKVCQEEDKGIFVLVKTSNPSSSELQDMVLSDGRTVYEAVADRVIAWGQGSEGRYGYNRAGAVVGATHPAQGAALRQRMPHTFFLLPGYGAQGASGKDLAGMFDGEGRGAVVNASRSLLCAWKKQDTQDFAAAARREALRMRDDIMQALAAR